MKKMELMMWTLMTSKQTNKQTNNSIFFKQLSILHFLRFLKIFRLITHPYLSRFREKLVLLLDKNVLLLAYVSMCPPGKTKAGNFYIDLFVKAMLSLMQLTC